MNLKGMTETEMWEYYKRLYIKKDFVNAEKVLKFLQENFNEKVQW